MKEPSLSTIKTLFALSRNVCAFYDDTRPGGSCEQRLTDPGWSKVLGEICHIYGARPGSARYDEAHESDGHEFWNLLLLCPTHHTTIDSTEPHRFSVEALLRMKDRAGAAAEHATPWCDDVTATRFASAALVSMRRLAQLATAHPVEDPTKDARALHLAERERLLTILRELPDANAPDLSEQERRRIMKSGNTLAHEIAWGDMELARIEEAEGGSDS